MKKMLFILLFLIGPTLSYAQPIIRDESIRPELDKAFAPLKTLGPKEMTAVAGLVLAARAGFPVEDYCPPLKKFSGPPKLSCESAVVSYAMARQDCRTPDQIRNCPKLLEAETNWAACESKLLGERLRVLKLVVNWPKTRPWPQPDPISGSK